MDNIIEKIQAKGQQIKQEKINEEAMKRSAVEKDYIAAKALSSRINKLWDICQALLDNGFTLGKTSYWVDSTYYEFETDGWYHWLGFLVKRKRGQKRREIIAFGIEGGGCCGRSVFINRQGMVGKFGSNETFLEDNIDDNCYISRGDNYSPKSGKTYQDPDFTYKLKRIVSGFDEFEAKVLAYANEIANS